MKVAVLGLGRMGRAVGARLADRGHDLTVWNRSPGRAAELVSRGAREAGDVAEATVGAEVVVSILANDDAVREVALGTGGLRSCMDEALYVDSSTISPQLTEELASAFRHFASMPVLGSPEAVRAGQAAYLLGGPAEVAARLEPLTSALSCRIKLYDRPGLASCAKLASNLMLLAGVVALAESFAVGRAGGLTDEDLRDLLGSSPMVASGLGNRFEAVLSGGGKAWWSTELGAKDAGLAVDVAAGAGVRLRAGEVVRDAYAEEARLSASEGREGSEGRADDIAAVARLYRRAPDSTLA